MRVLLRSLKREQLIALLFVLVLHGMVLYGLWSYRFIPTPDEAITLMVNLINLPPEEQPRLPRAEPPKPPELRPVELPKPQQLVAEVPVVLADEPVVSVPPAPLVVETLPLPPQPVTLSDELSARCPERSPPDYPSLSMRMNEQGKVILRVELGEDGRVARAEVKTGSGYRRLDDAALNAVKTWRCNLSVRDGVAVRAVALQPFNFILEGR